jgi:hypothetical protein
MDNRYWTDLISVPQDAFKGRDLTEMEILWHSDMRKKPPAGAVPDSVTNTTEPTVDVKPVDVAQVDAEASGTGEESDEEDEGDAGESKEATEPAPSAEDAKTQPDEVPSKATDAVDPSLPEHQAICDICRVCTCF